MWHCECYSVKFLVINVNEENAVQETQYPSKLFHAQYSKRNAGKFMKYVQS